MLAYVLNKHGKPLMPCSPRAARVLLDQKRAKVVSRAPFTIKLLYGSSGYKQPVTLGVDSGSKVIGCAAIGNGNTLYASEVTTRSDIHEKMSQRATYRRTRRGRKLRYRKARFSNRKRPAGWLTPTMRSKVAAHEREIHFVQSILPITKLIIETAPFDIHYLVNPDVESSGYQEGRQKDFYNVRQFVLFRDAHTCQKCLGKKKDKKLQVHHIVFRFQGGTNSPDNLVTLCKTCHDCLHLTAHPEKESLKLQKKRVFTKDAVQVSTTGAYLKKSLFFEETFGYETKYKRELLNYPKSHYADAVCTTLGDGEIVQFPRIVYQKKCIPLGDYQQTKGSHSEKLIPTGKILGFRKFDKVEWLGQELFIKGRMSTGYAVLMDITGKTIDFRPMPKMKLLKRLTARRSCLISQIFIENLSFADTENAHLETGALANL